MLRKLRDKKGVALETGIIFMLIMISFCTVLFIVAYKERIRDMISSENMNVPYKVEKIGENFYNACLEGTEEDFNYEDEEYISVVSNKNDIMILEVARKDNLDIILEVHVNMTNLKISKWCFYNPLYSNVLIRKVDSDQLDMEGEE